MASLGIVEMGSIVTRGWYRVEAGKCLRPDVHGEPHRLYSYGEAVDGTGRAIKHNGETVSWGGKVTLCTRDGKFELSDQKDCAARGLNSAGFAAIDVGEPARHHRAFQGTVTRLSGAHGAFPLPGRVAEDRAG